MTRNVSASAWRGARLPPYRAIQGPLDYFPLVSRRCHSNVAANGRGIVSLHCQIGSFPPYPMRQEVGVVSTPCPHEFVTQCPRAFQPWCEPLGVAPTLTRRRQVSCPIGGRYRAVNIHLHGIETSMQCNHSHAAVISASSGMFLLLTMQQQQYNIIMMMMKRRENEKRLLLFSRDPRLPWGTLKVSPSVLFFIIPLYYILFNNNLKKYTSVFCI